MAMVLRMPGLFDEMTSLGSFAFATRAIAKCRGVGSAMVVSVGDVPDASDSIKEKNISS